jgi:hypothetical protein
MRKSHNDEIDEIMKAHEARKNVMPHPSFGYGEDKKVRLFFTWSVIAALCVCIALITVLLVLVNPWK